MDKIQLRRERIYRYVVQRIEAGSAPTVREICKDLSVKSTSTVYGDLKALSDRGLILLTEGLNRAIRLPGKGSVLVPLVGSVAAGRPVLAVENIEQYIPAPAETGERDTFALRVKGDSMLGAAILPGDIVIVEKCANVRDGQIVVALVENEATVKTYYKEKDGRHRLQPENDAFEPIILERVDILGRVISVYRYLE